jgi:hypothetical protein
MISSALDGSSQVRLILKFAIRNERLLGLAVRHSLLLKFLVCRIDAIPDCERPETSEARFRDLDPIARSRITHYRLDSIHDIGVSSGVTSLRPVPHARCHGDAGEFPYLVGLRLSIRKSCNMSNKA